MEKIIITFENGTKKARIKASNTLEKVKSAMKIDYFKNDEYLKEIIAKYQEK